MATRSPMLLPLQFSFDAEEPPPMNAPPDEPAACIPLVDSTPPVSNAAALPDCPPVGNAVALLNAPGERGSTAALMQRHAQKQAQGLAPASKRDKLPRYADDTPLTQLVRALRDIPPDKLLLQAQDAQDFPAACRRLHNCANRWAKDIAEEVADMGRRLTDGERKGVAFWQQEARDAANALRVWYACGGNQAAAVEALQNGGLERYADALRTGCYVSLGL